MNILINLKILLKYKYFEKSQNFLHLCEYFEKSQKFYEKLNLINVVKISNFLVRRLKSNNPDLQAHLQEPNRKF